MSPKSIQDLVSETMHTYPTAQIELDPLPSGVCFLWVTVKGRNFALEYHPVQGTGVSENTVETAAFTGHDQFFPDLGAAITFYKQLLAGADQTNNAGSFTHKPFTPTVAKSK